jgi:hypothetical protein
LDALPESRDFRVARPVPARGGEWVASGWEATEQLAGGAATWTAARRAAYAPVIELALSYAG